MVRLSASALFLSFSLIQMNILRMCVPQVLMDGTVVCRLCVRGQTHRASETSSGPRFSTWSLQPWSKVHLCVPCFSWVSGEGAIYHVAFTWVGAGMGRLLALGPCCHVVRGFPSILTPSACIPNRCLVQLTPPCKAWELLVLAASGGRCKQTSPHFTRACVP